MKRAIIISIFVLGMIIPNINVKAVDVSNEEELRDAIEQGGDITLTNDIEVTQPLVIDKDVNISGYYIMMQGDNTLLTVNSGNVTIDSVDLIAGWSGEYYTRGVPDHDAIKNQGTALVVNDGNVNLDSASINAGKLGMIVNGGTIDFIDKTTNIRGIYSQGTAITVNNKGKVNLDLSFERMGIYSYESNGIEINEGGVVNMRETIISAAKNAIYLNGGTINLTNRIGLGHSESYYAIYINKGKNTVTNDSSLFLSTNLELLYKNITYVGTFKMPSIYVNPEISEVKVTDEKNFFHYENNKLKLDFCSDNASASNTDPEEGIAMCTNLYSNYDGPIYTNELGKCTAVYINGVKQNEVDPLCNPVTDNKNEPSQIVNVPATSAYASIIIITLGILCVIVSVIVTRKVTKKS